MKKKMSYKNKVRQMFQSQKKKIKSQKTGEKIIPEPKISS